MVRRSNPTPEARVATGRSNPTPKAMCSGREEELHIQGAVDAWAQEGLEEPSHVEGQEGRRSGDTPHPREGKAAALCWSKCEEIPYTQGRRNSSKMVGVARGHQRAGTLKPYSQKTSHLITLRPQPCLTQ